jgi:transcriptional regulator with XRE-family HTH domain
MTTTIQINHGARRLLPVVRAAKDQTQETLAEIIGVSTTTIRGWESGRTRPKLEHLSALATWAGVPLAVVASSFGVDLPGLEG